MTLRLECCLLAGVLASGSILIEKKARRAELALYVLPRAMQSVFATLLHRRLLPNLPLWEVGLFAVGMGALMHYRCGHDNGLGLITRADFMHDF